MELFRWYGFIFCPAGTVRTVHVAQTHLPPALSTHYFLKKLRLYTINHVKNSLKLKEIKIFACINLER